MRMKYALFALAPIGLVLQLGTASAAPNRQLGVRWEGTLEPEASKIVVYNLSPRPANAFLGTKVLSVPAGGAAEMGTAGLEGGPLSLRSSVHLLMLQTGNDFDAGSLEIQKNAAGQPRQAAGKLQPRFGRPDWTRELIANGPNVRHGATGAVGVKSDDPTARVEIAVEFVAPHSAVRIRQLDTLGNEVASVVASASKPVRWRASLGPVNGESRIELQTLRGEAQGTAAAVVEGGAAERAPVAPVAKSGGGLAEFTPDINWQRSPALTFTVTGGPASVCGDLYTSRNYGSYVKTPGWICTNPSGSASAGPWYWANQSGDEIGYAYIIWSNGSSTNTAFHIWDTTGPTATITSPVSSPVPTSFYGTGSDGSYGAGFSSSWGSSCSNYFYEENTDNYWDPYTNQYINAYFPVHVSCTISGMPSHSVTWSQSQIPPAYRHVSGRCYEWAVFLYESNDSNFYGNDVINFCIP